MNYIQTYQTGFRFTYVNASQPPDIGDSFNCIYYD